ARDSAQHRQRAVQRRPAVHHESPADGQPGARLIHALEEVVSMRKSFVTVIAAAILAAAIPALAHHASQAEVDKNSPKTISARLTRVQGTNPHVRWYLDIKNDKTGEVEPWMLQGSGPGAYKANGVSAPGVFPIGKTYTAMIAPARDGSNGGYVMTWALPYRKEMGFLPHSHPRPRDHPNLAVRFFLF